LSALAKEVFKNMSGKQALILVISVALIYYGSTTVNHYLDNNVEIKRIEASKDKDSALADVIKKVSDDDKEKMGLLAHAANARAVALVSEVERMKSALEFYANPEVYKPDSIGRVGDLTFSAKAALVPMENEK
jgi:ABC-type methionine transport system permease subunit